MALTIDPRLEGKRFGVTWLPASDEDDDDHGPVVRYVFQITAGGVEVLGMTITHDEGKPLDPDLLVRVAKHLPAEAERWASFQVLTERGRGTEGMDLETLTSVRDVWPSEGMSLGKPGPDRPSEFDDETTKALRQRRRRRKVTPELLREVAEVYRDADPLAPTKAVREHFGIETSQASRYVREARQAGYLEPLKDED